MEWVLRTRAPSQDVEWEIVKVLKITATARQLPDWAVESVWAAEWVQVEEQAWAEERVQVVEWVVEWAVEQAWVPLTECRTRLFRTESTLLKGNSKS